METTTRPGLIAGGVSTPALVIPPAALGLTVGAWRLDRVEPCPFAYSDGCPDRVVGHILAFGLADRFEIETVLDGSTLAEARQLAVMLDLADRATLPRESWPVRLIIPVLECGHIRDAFPLIERGEP